MKLKEVNYYEDMNARQQENYNFQKVAGKLADYGFNLIRLTDDWQGADAIAIHNDGKTFLKVQIKGRVTFDKKYMGKGIYIGFQDQKSKNCYLYPHDAFSKAVAKVTPYQSNKAWKVQGNVSWSEPTRAIANLLKKHKI